MLPQKNFENYDSKSVNSCLFLIFYRTSKSDIKMFSSMSSMGTTWVECIESCRNFKVDVHSIVGVIKEIAFLTHCGTHINFQSS